MVESSGTLNLSVNSTATAVTATGAGLLRLVSPTNGPATPDLYFGPNHNANSYWGTRLETGVDLGTATRYVFGKTGHNGIGKYGLTNADCQFAGPISGSGGLTIIAQNTWTGSDPMEAGFALNGANTFTGPLEIQRGSIYLGNPGALTRSNILTFNVASGNNGRLFLYGKNAVVSDLSSTGAGTASIANGNRKTGSGVTLGAATLTVVENNPTTFSGVISDVVYEYDGTGTGTTGPLLLQKLGPARLTLSGLNTYTGNTTVGAGTLQLDGSVASPVLVQAGGALAGAGSIDGTLTVQDGATLAPGADGIGTMTVNGACTLGGTARFEISKAGIYAYADRLLSPAIAFGGSLVVTNLGPGILSEGDSFKLFTSSKLTGAFTNISLPPPGTGRLWDTADLAVNGSITLVPASGAPIISTQPQSVTIPAGSTASFTVSAAGGRPLSYQWRKDGAAIVGATQSSLTLASASTNDQGGYTVFVTNSVSAITSSIAVLTITVPLPPSTITNGLVVYLGFDSNLLAQASTTNKGSLYTGGATLGPRYKPGVIGAAASFANVSNGGQPSDWAVTLGDLEWIYSGSFSISFWQRTTTSGDGALCGNKNWSSGANVGWVISSLDPKNVNWNAVGGTRRDVSLNPPFSDGNWHLVSVTFDRAANRVNSYIDGQVANTSDISPSGAASFNAGFPTLIGSSGNGTYSGAADVDDFGIWTRVLSPDEIAAIYHSGLIGQPLYSAAPGQVPVISTDPKPLTVAVGGTATFSVQATGPGPLSYQWRFNGVNIAGATNSTLALGTISAASQGVYTVLVSNGNGGTVSAAATLAVYELAVTGQWDFLFGDLRATVGNDLEFISDTANVTGFPAVEIGGRPTPAMSFGALTSTQGYYARHGIKPNGGGLLVNQYTLLMDVMYPSPGGTDWRALLQTDPFNHPDNDADFYIGNASTTPDPNGIGADSQFHGTLAPDQWYRLTFAVDLAAAPGSQLAKYVNGVKVGSQSLAGGIDGRYALGSTAQLFTSGLAGAFTRPGFVSSLQFVNGCLGADAIAGLGGPGSAKLPAGNAALRITTATIDAGQFTLNWSGPDGWFQVQKSAGLLDSNWVAVNGLVSNRSLTLASAGATGFYRVRQPRSDIKVGMLPLGEQSIPSKQILKAAGQQLQIGGRPVDLALSPDGQTIFVKNLGNLLVIDAVKWKLLQTLSYPGSGASMHGIAVSQDGSHVYVTGSGNELYEWAVGTNGVSTSPRTISLPASSDPCGLALSADGSTAYVCLGLKNTLAIVNLATGGITRQINVGVAPLDVVLSTNGATAYVSDWGGRKVVAGDLTATSGGTAVVIDARGVAASGVVSFVDLNAGTEIAQVPAGLHPSDLELSRDGATLFVANANSDTVTIMDTQTRQVRETILVRPDPAFPYGSAANALALSRDGTTLFAATAGNNAVAVIELPNASHTNSLVRGFLPTDWYPGGLVADAENIYLVNVKGLGSRLGQPANTSWSIGAHLGTANKLRIPDAEALSKFTAQAFEQGRVPEIKAAYAPARPDRQAVPVPARKGEPSVFQHVVYILKENKTYDQMFGDLPQGNGDPNLCIYPRFVSPNHHALAEQYVLLDNFYCQGVNSADGHSWSTEGNVTDHLEKSFGGFVRSYTFGDDPLTYSSSGFIWNNVLEHGLTFRNYGEMDYASSSPASTWLQIYKDFTNGTRAIRFPQNIGVASLRPFSSTNVPGWNLDIPDIIRADGFIRELAAAQSNGVWEAFHFLYLPNDHTGGTPTGRAQVADNDLALGRVVEAITHSSFASNTVIMVIEDDPQSGYDHVDGHRSICLVVSPYTKRGEVVSTFYNQAGVLHTIERILGLPPMNQQDAMAPIMFDCFTNTPNFTPYHALANNVDLAEGVPATAKLSPLQRYWARRAAKLDLSRPDRIDDDVFNRFIWHSIKGDAPYPAEFVGAHGRGLKKLGLVLDKTQTARTDDD